MASSVSINRIEKNNKSYLQFDFSGDLSEAIANQAIADWKSKMPSDKSKISLIFECNHMSGFETGARRNWQATMNELKNQIGEVWVICDNIFILTAARTMGIISGFNIKAVRSNDQVI